ncbi:hypothetical protein ASG01_01415 [Chryseobacterium sp. Leaf180]|uniref:hypothetical protein n=1 Tax=Chryseobacterium sp. Leaf180 TaxID=1736289 RepID=UPI0006F9B653|nr:hypothetical protein [Chryseobacterium sp. Leaf180]KQR94571.1 hypothetical protein ASG01_01415 [Chryseobacterium sp. Leaf180]
MIRKLFTFYCLIFYVGINAQEGFLLPDNPPKCYKIKEGKFVKQDIPGRVWNMLISKDLLKEYLNNSKTYIKYKLKFEDDCHFTATVTSKSDSKNMLRIGDVVRYSIIETDHDLIRVKTDLYNKSEDFVLQKTE